MPRYVIQPSPPSPKHERFVHLLAQEFASTSANIQPLILEELVPATNSRHVRVIWDRWKDLDPEQRSAIIVDAYTQAEGAQAATEIAIAEGFTPQEALALGLLPLKVVPLRKKNERISLEAYEKALRAEAAKTLLGPKAKELRYARTEDAQQAYERLEKALPSSSWAVVQEMATES